MSGRTTNRLGRNGEILTDGKAEADLLNFYLPSCSPKGELFATQQSKYEWLWDRIVAQDG